MKSHEFLGLERIDSMDNPNQLTERNQTGVSSHLSAQVDLSRDHVRDYFNKHFDSLDRNKDGFLGAEELVRGLSDLDYGSQSYKAVYSLYKNVSIVEEISNDEFGDENDGITRQDLNGLFRDRSGKTALKKLDETIGSINRNPDSVADLSAANARISAAARTIREATKRDNLLDTGTDEETIFSTLANLSQKDRDELKVFYKSHFHIALADEIKREMSGSELDRAINLLNKRDGVSDDAGFLHELLLENDEWFGRSSKAIARALRDKIACMSESEITRLDEEYNQRYGTGLRRALWNSTLEDHTKRSLDIYLKGADKRTAKDTLALADIALSKGDLAMFEQSMRSASSEARTQFLASDGESRIVKAFGSPPYRWHRQNRDQIPASQFSKTEKVVHALQYARDGKLSTATLIRENTSWLGDNERAIETALAQMTESERSMYEDGRALSNGRQVPGITESEKQNARQFYKDVYDALDGAADNTTQMARWEDMISVKGGSLISKLAEHRGMLWDDSTDAILSTIENMSKEDWERLIHDPYYRGNIENSLSPFLSNNQIKRARDVLDRKQKSTSFEDSKLSGRRTVFDTIRDNKHRGFLWLDNKEEGIWRAIENMTPGEQKQYREDPGFREKLDRELRSSLDEGVELAIARSLLEKVSRGDKPEMTMMEKLGAYSRHFMVNEGKVIREVEQAFRDDPELLERIKNPKDEQDRAFSKEFKARLRKALDPADYARYGVGLLEKGYLPIELHIELNESIFGTCEKGLLEALQNHPMKDKLSSRESGLLNRVLSRDERVLAGVVMDQGGLQDEDKLRSFVLGSGVKQEEVMQMLEHKSIEERQDLFDEYARKYGRDATSDFINQLGNSDKFKGEAVSELADKSLEEKLSQAITWHSKKRDGVGSAFVDAYWDGTGYQVDTAFARLAQLAEAKSISGLSPSSQRQLEMRENLLVALENHSESKKQLAEISTDAAIAVAAVGGAFCSGGLSLSLLAKGLIAGTAGAALKVGGKAGIMGSDYNWSPFETALDGGRGFLFASTAFLGPGELAHVFRIGNTAGKHATGLTTTHLAKLANSAGIRVLKEGSEETIERGMTAMIRHALVSGSHKVSHESVNILASKVAQKGQEELAKKAIYYGLGNVLRRESGRRATAALIEYGLPAAAGGISGSASGTLQGISEIGHFDTTEEKITNVLKRAGQVGAVGVTVSMGFKLGFKGVEKGNEFWRARTGSSSHGGEHVITEKTSDRLSDKFTEIFSEKINEAAEHGAARLHFGQMAGEAAEHAAEKQPQRITAGGALNEMAGASEHFAGRVNRMMPASEPFNKMVEQTEAVPTSGGR